MPDTSRSAFIAVTGATGYIGGRLVPRLLEGGHRIRCLVRDRNKSLSRPWANDQRIEIVQCDLADEAAVCDALRGCSAAYYLVHSMLVAGDQYAQHDRAIAEHFGGAAAQAGLQRIIYLGGLGERGPNLSEHLASRRDVENALRLGGVPVTVLRAAMIIGSGSASFEILRYLVERLPIMITPRWVSTECQPIAVRNVLEYLVRCIDEPRTIGQTLDIGGPEVLTYRQIMTIMAQAAGLRARLVIPVPVLSPRLSSLWIHLVTPISHRVARPLAEGLRNRVVCRDNRAAELMPQKLLTVREAIDAALGKSREHEVPTRWSDAGEMPGDPDWAGGTMMIDRRECLVNAPAHTAFNAVCQVGGSHGYHAADWLWRIRGAMDRLAGGPGLRRGRRHPQEIHYGDALDFWRVTRVEQDRALELRAEMKLPGIATLSFEINPFAGDPSMCRLTQTARFKPRGLGGILYWYAVLPLHHVVFNGMLRGIQRAACA